MTRIRTYSHGVQIEHRTTRTLDDGTKEVRWTPFEFYRDVESLLVNGLVTQVESPKSNTLARNIVELHKLIQECRAELLAALAEAVANDDLIRKSEKSKVGAA